MYVDISGNRSCTRQIDIGLPQGSASSPYLFSLYINDMHRSSEKLKFIHFADDTTVSSANNLFVNRLVIICIDCIRRLVRNWGK